MPLITVQLIEGRSRETRRALIAAIGEAVASNLGVPSEAIRTTLIEISPDSWGVGCQTMADVRVESRPPGEAS